ncbi:MAG: sulfite exporter TauE/SafE family protein [Clostridia bacterium]|nr:sulfite exporter TauE/SafE family protein [Clostridia bacterium]
MKSLKKYIKPASFGLAVGLVNGVFGAGGGMLAVPLLKAGGLDQKQAHANAVAVILPITIISAILYLLKGTVSIKDSLLFLPTGLIGSVIATFALKNISSVWLKRIFGGFMIYAGVRLLLK